MSRRRARCAGCGATTIDGVCALCVGPVDLHEQPEAPKPLRELLGNGLRVRHDWLVDQEPDPRGVV